MTKFIKNSSWTFETNPQSWCPIYHM